jgi:hypothetical protein
VQAAIGRTFMIEKPQLKMRLVNTKAHAVYDYLMGLLLFAAPFIFNYNDGGSAQMVSSTIGTILFLTGLFTKYEFGIIKALPLKQHLFFDAMIGGVLAASPWLFHFSEIVFKPHLVYGLSIIAVSLLTDRVTAAEVTTLIEKAKLAKKQQRNFAKKETIKNENFKFIYNSREEELFKTAHKSLKFSSK